MCQYFPNGRSRVSRGWPALLLSLMVLLAMCGTGRAQAVASTCPAYQQHGQAWLAPSAREAHPLAGRVLAVDTGSLTALGDFPALLAGALAVHAPLLLLGEVHDNPVHHALRAGLIALMACSAPKPPAVVLEHIRAEQQDVLAGATRSTAQRPTSADLFRVLEWEKSGWPAASLFAPLLDAALGSGLAILHGDPARGRVRALSRGEPQAIPADERARLRLDVPMPQPLLDALAAELKDSHCGMLPERAIAGLSSAQQYRDAHLADALLAAAEKHGSAILLAGNGHLRSDRGVPWHIRQRAPDRHSLSVLFLEVDPGKSDAIAYVPRDPDSRPAADFIVFTPRAERPDPCEAMRRHMQKKG